MEKQDYTAHTATAKPIHDYVEFNTNLIAPSKYSKTIIITKPGQYEYFDNLASLDSGKDNCQ